MSILQKIKKKQLNSAAPSSTVISRFTTIFTTSLSKADDEKFVSLVTRIVKYSARLNKMLDVNAQAMANDKDMLGNARLLA